MKRGEQMVLIIETLFVVVFQILPLNDRMRMLKWRMRMRKRGDGDDGDGFRH